MDSLRKEARPTNSSPLIVFGIVAISVVLAGFLSVRARQLDWTLGLLYVRFFVAILLIHLTWLLLFNPIVLARRIFISPGTKTWDIVWTVTFIVILLAMYFVARHELDRSKEPSPHGITWTIGAAIFLFGWAIVTWAMMANPFFEKTVRIQTDHGHRVIDHGPYAIIRHPGYVGFTAILLSTPLLLDSTWTFLPAGLAVMSLGIRTILEDRTLQAELADYAEYATRVRFRWMPGVW